MSSTSVVLQKLASDIVRELYGDLVEKICDVLISKGRLNISDLVKFTNLPEKQLRNGVLVLIQQNIVAGVIDENDFGTAKFTSNSIAGSYQYEICTENIIHRLRFPKFLLQTKEKLGEKAEYVLSEMLTHGRLQAQAAIQSAYTAYALNPLTAPNLSNDEAVDKEEFRSAFCALVAAHFVERVAPLGLPVQVVAVPSTSLMAPIVANYFANRFLLPPSLSAAPAAQTAHAAAEEKESIPAVDSQQPKQPPAAPQEPAAGPSKPAKGKKKKGDDADQAEKPAAKGRGRGKRKKGDEEVPLEGDEAPEDGSGKAASAAEAAAMAASLALSLAHENSAAPAAPDTNQHRPASKKARLDTGRPGDSGAAEDVADKEVLWRVNYQQFIRVFRHARCLEMLVGKFNALAANMVKAILARTAPYERSTNDAATATFQLNDLVKDIIPVLADEKKTATASTATAAAASGPGGNASSKGKVEEKEARLKLEQYLNLLVNDKARLASRVGETATAFTLNLQRMVEMVRMNAVHSIVSERFGPPAARILHLLLTRKHLEDKQVADLAMISIKETRTLLHQLLHHRFVNLQEVPKSSLRDPKSTFYLWSVDLKQVYDRIQEHVYMAMLNLRKRMAHEIAQGIGDADQEHQRVVSARVDRLEATLLHLDDTLLLFTLF